MQRAILWTMLGLAASCSSSSSKTSTGDGTTALEGGARADAMTTTGEASAPPPNVDASSATPPASTCTSPIAAADTSAPTHVVGSGTAASCTSAALTSALAAGGVVTFNCGSLPTTITVTATIELPTTLDTVIDGGGTVTIDGGGKVRILDWNSGNYRSNRHSLTLQHITFAHGHATGTMPYAPAPLPCSSGYYDGSGGALQMSDGILHVIDATFLNNQAEVLGPDVGGGAIYVEGSLGAIVSGSTPV